MNQKKAKQMRRLAQAIANNEKPLGESCTVSVGPGLMFDPARTKDAAKALYRGLKAEARRP